MRGKNIDFISAYCDRWCERCAFTDRCSSYAVQVALQMTEGNFKEAVELAVGAPPPRTAAEVKRREAFAAEMASIPEPTPQEMRQMEQDHDAQEERIEDTSLTTASERAQAAQVATELRALQREAEAAFPNARKFHRPGFDGSRRLRWRLW